MELEEKFNNLVAEVDGIKPEEVTVTYIHEQREKRFYPNMRYIGRLEKINDEIMSLLTT